MDYLATVLGVEKYLAAHQVDRDEGTVWDISESFHGDWNYYDEISLYAGSAGIIKFYLDLYSNLQDSRYLKIADQAGKYLVYRWQNQRTLKKAFSPYAITTGYSGIAFILDELFDFTNQAIYRDTVQEILQAIIDDQTDQGAWSGQIGVVADGGTALLLAKLGPKYQLSGFQAALAKFGDYVLKQQHHDQFGQYYIGLDLKFVGGPNGKFNTGFPLGPSGVAFVLLKIWEITGQEKYRLGTQGIDDFYRKNSLDQTKIVLPHYLPDDEHICYVGYCGGPTGVARYFYQEWQLEHDQRHLELLKDSIAGLDYLKAPEERSAGYWELDNYCCSSAGLLQMYIGAYLATKDDNYLEKAKVTAEIIIKRASEENGQVKWVQSFERKNPAIKTAALGYYDGAAGIAASLLQLHQLLNHPDTLHIYRMLDDPFPAEVS